MGGTQATKKDNARGREWNFKREDQENRDVMAVRSRGVYGGTCREELEEGDDEEEARRGGTRLRNTRRWRRFRRACVVM